MSENQGGQESPESGTGDSSATTIEATPKMERRKAERRVADPAVKAAVERRRTERRATNAAAKAGLERRKAERRSADAAAKPAVERRKAERRAADAAAKPVVERRKAAKSLLERRVDDSAAKGRRAIDGVADGGKTAEPAHEEFALANSAAKERTGFDRGFADYAINLIAWPRVGGKPVSLSPGGESAMGDIRVREQQNVFNEMALWMRKSGALLIGLNVLTLIAVFISGRSRPSQLQEMAEMRKAAVSEIQRAAAVSGKAAYATCLESQTARNMMLQMRLEETGPRIGPRGLQTVAATYAQAAQLAFDVEKTTSVNAHIPVLFHLGIENIGISSALDAKVWGEVRVLDSGKEPDFRYDDPALEKKTISPSDPEAKVVLYTTAGGMVAPLKEADFERVSSGAAYVVAYGRMVYEDTFGARHWVQFCHHITEPAGAGRHSGRCMAYNGSGENGEMAGRAPERSMPPQAGERQRAEQTAAVAMPEIACEVPKEEKN